MFIYPLLRNYNKQKRFENEKFIDQIRLKSRLENLSSDPSYYYLIVTWINVKIKQMFKF